MRRHKTQSDGDIKPKHRIGQGPVQVLEEPVHVGQEEPHLSTEEEMDLPDDRSEDGSLPEQISEELFSSQNYTFLK
jgi:hypothetical protein